MKRNLLTLIAAGAIVTAGFAVAQSEDEQGGPGGPHRGHGHFGGNPLEHLTKTLNLTADQQAKVKPIVDQAAPQLKAIHEEAMTKAKGVMDNAMSQIRPILTAEQQQKADAMQKAHQDMHKAMKEMHDAHSAN